MDFQAIVDGMSAMTCVVSVENLPDGKYGKFRLVTGNKAYIDSIEHPAPGVEMLTDKFTPNSEYTDYLTRDLNFEDFCYRAAVKKKCLHSYAHPDRMDVWFNMTFLPLGQEVGEICYCLYIMEINFEPDSQNFASTSSDIASSVLDTCIKLRGTKDFRDTMYEVIGGIRELCDAEHCCILTMDEYERSCDVLCEAFREGSKLLSMEHYADKDFYDIADSWTSTIAGSNCLIAKNEQDMEIVKERNPIWFDSLTSAGVNNIVLFPLKSRNQLLGYMWALNFDPGRAVKIKETLEATSFILGAELGNNLLLDRLRLLSSKDMLTGVMNRNEMNNYVDELSRGVKDDGSVGVIFADLNGLKTVNDQSGHNAGDKLLKNAAKVLRSLFPEKSIFRAGGDEFAIIVADVTEADVEEKIEQIRKGSEKYDSLSFALGGCVEKSSSNVRMALRHADERMYLDKQKYYETYPEQAAARRKSRERAPEQTSEALVREDRIQQEMNYDPLTGLPSMALFFRLAERGRRIMHEKGEDSALIFLNLNGLRFFNQRCGFSEGDALIKELSCIVAELFGRENSSRFGQDHFAAFTKAEGLEQKLEQLFKLMKRANNGKTLTVRVGIYPDSMGIVETALACDRARYACDVIKDSNKSYFTYFDKKMLQKEINRQYVIDNLTKAINENWITAYYQPIVSSESKKVCDEEALARWIDPQKGILSPADFIPILEDAKLIYKVDLHIVDIILERLKKQMASKIGTVAPISINLSRTDFEMCDIVEEICNRVDAAGVPRDLITIEITESVIGQNLDFMKEQVDRFQSLGFKVWMDDFGSGYSSLDLLQDLRFDLIKFDMRFMRQFDSSPRSRLLLTELMRMANNLRIETVTEGVETAEQVDFLSSIGCTKLQGFYFGKPIPYDMIQDRFKKGERIRYNDKAATDKNAKKKEN
ncbi:MAG: EAL domain-containing protein [Lachnospiraceae bacterium]|nr:EAL domain-containing protein [Lachnospiraceae bacterium]